MPSEIYNEYCSHVVLRPHLRFKEYSQNENEPCLDEKFKFSYKSAKYNQKTYKKPIKSEMSYYEGGNEENE